MTRAELDLLVAGGGPTGLAAAILAARAGMRVAVVEPKPGIIDKACGEGLMPGAVAALEALGVAPSRAFPFRGIRYVQGESSVQADFPRGIGLGVRRLELHQALLLRAEELGVERMETSVEELVQHEDRVEAAGRSARFLLAADGLRSPIRRRLGLELPPRRMPRIGLRRHFRVSPWSAHVEVHWSETAEAYLTPVAENEVGLAFLVYEDRMPRGEGPPFERLLRGFPTLAERLLEPCSRVRGAGPFEQRVRRRVQGRVLLVGDAAGYLDPLTGEGLRLGFAAAQAAIACIQRGRPQAYERAWRRLARRYWWLTSALLGITRPLPLRRRLVPTLARVPFLMKHGLGLLADDDPLAAATVLPCSTPEFSPLRDNP